MADDHVETSLDLWARIEQAVDELAGSVGDEHRTAEAAPLEAEAAAPPEPPEP